MKKNENKNTEIFEKENIDIPLLNIDNKESVDKSNELNEFELEKKSFNMWTIIIIIGNIAQVFGSGLCLSNTDYVLSVESLVGIGCFFAYLNIIKY